MIDGTCGNGLDTLNLARVLGPSGTILSFDIQDQAIQTTKVLLRDELEYNFDQVNEYLNLGHSQQGPEIKIFKQSHEFIRDYKNEAPGEIKLVAFNLGYLPGGVKTILTQAESTLIAVKGALEVLGESGMVTIIAYRGHPEGLAEYEALTEFLNELDSTKWIVSEFRINNRTKSPVLLTILKLM